MVMPINVNELTKEQATKALSCETVEELIEFAKGEGIELTKEEAEAYMADMEDMELDGKVLKQVAGGKKTCYVESGGQCSAVSRY